MSMTKSEVLTYMAKIRFKQKATGEFIQELVVLATKKQRAFVIPGLGKLVLVTEKQD